MELSSFLSLLWFILIPFILVLAQTIATVMFLILVLDNPRLSRLNQKPLLTLQRQLE